MHCVEEINNLHVLLSVSTNSVGDWAKVHLTWTSSSKGATSHIYHSYGNDHHVMDTTCWLITKGVTPLTRVLKDSTI